jgi:hypothetical protein
MRTRTTLRGSKPTPTADTSAALVASADRVLEEITPWRGQAREIAAKLDALPRPRSSPLRNYRHSIVKIRHGFIPSSSKRGESPISVIATGQRAYWKGRRID